MPRGTTWDAQDLEQHITRSERPVPQSIATLLPGSGGLFALGITDMLAAPTPSALRGLRNTAGRGATTVARRGEPSRLNGVGAPKTMFRPRKLAMLAPRKCHKKSQCMPTGAALIRHDGRAEAPQREVNGCGEFAATRPSGP